MKNENLLLKVYLCCYYHSPQSQRFFGNDLWAAILFPHTLQGRDDLLGIMMWVDLPSGNLSPFKKVRSELVRDIVISRLDESGIMNIHFTKESLSPNMNSSLRVLGQCILPSRQTELLRIIQPPESISYINSNWYDILREYYPEVLNSKDNEIKSYSNQFSRF